MKVAVFGIDDFEFGKSDFFDERLEELQEIVSAKKIVPLQIEFVPPTQIKDADVVVTTNDKKSDLILTDLEYVEERLTKELPTQEKDLFARAKALLEAEQFLSSKLSAEELKLLRGFPLVTNLPVYLLSDINDIENQEVLKQIYALSGRSYFFTAGEKEARMWPIHKGDTAWDAAGCIHSDIQQGFIRAEVVAADELIAAGHYNQARSEGKIRLENKEYVVKEGDVILFRANK